MPEADEDESGAGGGVPVYYDLVRNEDEDEDQIQTSDDALLIAGESMGDKTLEKNPPTVRDAMAGASAHHWRKAMDDELKSLKDNATYSEPCELP